MLRSARLIAAPAIGFPSRGRGRMMLADYIAARHNPYMENTAKVRFDSWRLGWKIHLRAALPVPAAERHSPAIRQGRAGARRKP
jgi:hypothetical protein